MLSYSLKETKKNVFIFKNWDETISNTLFGLLITSRLLSIFQNPKNENHTSNQHFLPFTKFYINSLFISRNNETGRVFTWKYLIQYFEIYEKIIYYISVFIGSKKRELKIVIAIKLTYCSPFHYKNIKFHFTQNFHPFLQQWIFSLNQKLFDCVHVSEIHLQFFKHFIK